MYYNLFIFCLDWTTGIRTLLLEIRLNPVWPNCWPTEGVGISQREFFSFPGLELEITG